MANKKLSATITIGGAVAASLKSAFGDVKGQITQVGSALAKLEGQQRLLSSSIKTFGAMGKNVDGMRARYAAITTQIDKLRVAHQRLNSAQAAQQANLARRADLRGQIFDAVALGATAATPIVKAAQFETAMLGVAKQIDGARDSSGRLTAVYFDMAKQVQLLGREIPIATNEIAAMVAAGARMGVAKDELIGFTRTAAMMAEAFELPAGELADQMGKIAGLFKIPIPAIGDLADAINYLDDNAISKGGDIIEFLTRTGGVAASVKVTGKEMAALGSTLLTLGERTETAGTAVNAMFQKLAAADKGTKKFRSAMKEIGLSTAAVQKGMQADATGTLMKVMEAIGKLPKEKQLGVMVELVGLEHSDTLAKLANNTAEWRRQLELANGAAAKGSMSREFQARMQTTNAQWQVMKNQVEELAVNIGSVLLPAVNSFFGVIGPVFSAMADFAQENPKLTKAVVGTAVAFTSLRLATLAGSYAFTFIKGGVLQVSTAFAKLRAGLAMAALHMPKIASGVRLIGAAFISTGIGALVAGLAMGGLYIYRHWDGIKAFMVGIFQGISEGLQPVVDIFGALRDALKPLHPAFEAVGGALKSVWQWFTSLLEPVTYTKDELARAGEQGKTFGMLMAEGLRLALLPLTKLIEGLTWVINNIDAITAKVVQFKNAAGDKIGAAWDSTKGAWNSVTSFFGGDEPAKTGNTPAPSALPKPTMATTGSGLGPYYDQSQTTLQITQMPGENSRDLARRIAEEQERQRMIRQRGLMLDGAPAQ